jgi:hypothetical protein
MAVQQSVIEGVAAVIAASVPGVLVALLSHYLTLRRENQVTRRLIANARTLLGLEMERNRAALDAFWRGMNDLDHGMGDLDKDREADDAEGHLAGMAYGGLIRQTPPHWSFTRWERIAPQALATLSEQELAEIDQSYRDLRTVSDLFSQLVTFTPEERAILDKDHWWFNRYADWRMSTFQRLAQVTNQVLAAPNPLHKKARL